MGLAKSVAVRFPEWGPDFAAVLYGMVRFPTIKASRGQNLYQKQALAIFSCSKQSGVTAGYKVEA